MPVLPKSSSVKDVQPTKLPVPSDSSEEGTVTWTSDVQPKKRLSGMACMPEGIETVSSMVLLMKAPLAREVTS